MSAELFLSIGRILTGSLFVIAGVRHFLRFAVITTAMRERGVPLPELVQSVGNLWSLTLGLLLVAGVAVPWSAGGLAVFLIAATVMFHDFWNRTGERRALSINVCFSNLAILGGLILAGAIGA